ncbi:PepSY domain-containing protein [Comamonas testosteroni]|uniref:PepSY-associated TM helix domain-containing protein n=1 Tax=Comamonas testosteroni TaxID=285 RepID=UPI00265F66EA|nr:PepSY domain-containing protein [Comamonas testosteroni]WKL16359.1 PepSY domain-containing protein [Comamonas testosteroni]
MSSVHLNVEQKPSEQRLATDLYRAVWRWHFYAGLLVLPFLIWLAITGGIYVFKNQVDDFFHHELKSVTQASNQALPDGQLAAAALAAHPGTLVRYTPPPSSTRSAEALIATNTGERLSVFIDPYSARVLGALPDGGSVAWTVRKLHSLKYFGSVARGVIEIAAGWSILLVLTGIYLWWPRGRSGGVISVRGKPVKRIFWRDLHAVTGLFVGGILLFLAVTGMPWSVFWGAKVNQWANGQNYGYPSGVRVQIPMSEVKLSEGGNAAWSLLQAKVPRSGHEGHEGHEGQDQSSTIAEPLATGLPPALTLDQAIAIFKNSAISAGYAVQWPKGSQGVYTASVYPEDISQQRVIHLDQYSGRPLLDMSFADYGPVGKSLEWGINVHLGQEFGVLNQALLTVACLGIILLCVSAAVMWWKRRPSAGLGAPPLPSDRRVLRGVLAMLFLGGVLFPLVGLSLLVMALADWIAFSSSRSQRANS